MNRPTVHATAIVIATTGLLFVGPSGTGKSSVALSCLAAARRRGMFSALVADDRVIVTAHGPRLVARAPETISGCLELRGSGILRVETVAAARLHYAVRPVTPPFDERIAPEFERFPLEGIDLPLLRLPLLSGTEPLDLLLRIMVPPCSGS